MKIKMIRIRLALGVITSIVALSAVQATLAQKSNMYNGTFTAKKMPLAVSDQLAVSLNGLKPGSDYVLGFKRGSKPVVTASQVQMASPQPGTHVVSGMRDWSDITVSGGMIQVHGLDAMQGAFMLYAVIPPGTDVRVDVNGESVAHFRPSEDTVVHDGAVATMSHGLNFGTLMIQLMSPPSASNEPEVMQTQTGTFFATGALKAHLTSFRLPNPSSTQENEMMKIQIDQSGAVISASPASGTYAAGDSFGPACESVLLAWRFRPFTFNGKAVAVSGVITLVSENGRVETTATPR